MLSFILFIELQKEREWRKQRIEREKGRVRKGRKVEVRKNRRKNRGEKEKKNCQALEKEV